MCGRYFLEQDISDAALLRILETLEARGEDVRLRGDIFPGDRAPALADGRIQAMRWGFAPDGGGYTGVAFGRVLHVTQDGGSIMLHGVDRAAYEAVWADYFDLARDYEALSDAFCGDEALRTAYAFSRGIRILAQDPWETLCSFILSQNNNIPRIRKIIASLCERFGAPIAGTPFYAFPTAERLAEAGMEGLAEIRCGFRAKYVADAAARVASGALDLEALRKQSYETAKAALMTVYGVGAKVADCVLLFSLGFYEAFPVDVWVKKVIAKYYGEGFDGRRFGAYAGVAQQYLFYYERSLSGR